MPHSLIPGILIHASHWALTAPLVIGAWEQGYLAWATLGILILSSDPQKAGIFSSHPVNGLNKVIKYVA